MPMVLEPDSVDCESIEHCDSRGKTFLVSTSTLSSSLCSKIINITKINTKYSQIDRAMATIHYNRSSFFQAHSIGMHNLAIIEFTLFVQQHSISDIRKNRFLW